MQGAAILEHALAQVDLSGLPERVERVDVLGSPAGALIEASRGADLVVVGTGKHHGLGTLVGSVAQQISQHAPCPAVFVPPPSDTPTG
jgi:nucleotide-binding universal stress UspA family protein